MGIGESTLKRVFDAVCENQSMTRTDIAALLGTSTVTASGAVDALLRAGLTEAIGPDVSEGRGRRAELIAPSQRISFLLIDLCKKNAHFTLTAPGEKPHRAEVIPCLETSDTYMILESVASGISKYLSARGLSPSLTAVALPSFDPLYGTETCTKVFSGYGIQPRITVSGGSAASAFCNFLSATNERHAFISIDSRVWGCESGTPDRMLLWERIKVGKHHGESFGSVLQYETDESHLRIYLRRLVSTVDSVLAPDRIFVASSFLPTSVMRELDGDPKTVDISRNSPVLSGLWLLARDKIFEDSSFIREKQKHR